MKLDLHAPIAGALVILLVAGCATRAVVRTGEPLPPRPIEPAQTVDEPVPDLLDRIYVSLAAGDPQAAVAAYEQARGSDPDSTRTRVLYGRLLLLAGDTAGARAELEAALEDTDDPTVIADARLGLAVIAGLAGELDVQERQLEAVLAIRPEDVDALAMLAEIDAQTDDLVAAESGFRAALAHDSRHLQSLLGLGNVLVRDGRAEEARGVLDEAVEVAPDYAFAFSDRARARFVAGDDPGALADLDRAIELDPEFAWHYLDRGRIKLRNGETDAALEDFDRTLELDPDNFLARVYRGGIRFERDRWADALVDLERVRELRDDYYFVYPQLAILYYIFERWQDARTALSRAIDADATEPAYHLLVALTHLQEDDRAAAAAAVEPVYRAVPRDSWYWATARYLAELGSLLTITSRIQNERDLADRARMSVYAAEVELLAGRSRTAFSLFLDALERTESNFLERKIALARAVELQGDE